MKKEGKRHKRIFILYFLCRENKPNWPNAPCVGSALNVTLQSGEKLPEKNIYICIFI